MLHILDGDCSARTLRCTDVPGKKFAWREALIEGPTPAGVEGDEWLALRAKHLAGGYELSIAECETRLREQQDVLASLGEHEEVVLWFEHDLFCQANLISILSWCADSGITAGTKITLVSIDRFAEIEDFRGLGQLNPEQLASLFPARREVTSTQLATAANAWTAYRSNDPTALQTVIQTETAALPFLHSALRLHLARFPSTLNGLGRVESKLLGLIADGSEKFVDLFQGFGALEPRYGFGDLQLWLALQRMANMQNPLVNMKHDGSSTEADIRDTNFELTSTGADVLHNRNDAVDLNGIDQWLGGVHLQVGNVWRWDDTNSRITKD